MKRALVSSLAIAGLFVASSAFAGTQDNAKIAGHLTALQTKNQCTTNAPQEFGCDSDGAAAVSNLINSGDVGISYALYMVVLDIAPGAGVQGASFGIDYDGAGGSGLDFFGWNSCSDLEFPGGGWPEAGGGNVMTWTVANCQNTVDPTDPQGEAKAILGWGYVYAYSADLFTFTKRNFIPVPDFAVADCAAAQTDLPLTSAGGVGFGQPGIDPCFTPQTAVEPSTWGGIKKLD